MAVSVDRNCNHDSRDRGDRGGCRGRCAHRGSRRSLRPRNMRRRSATTRIGAAQSDRLHSANDCSRDANRRFDVRPHSLDCEQDADCSRCAAAATVRNSCRREQSANSRSAGADARNRDCRRRCTFAGSTGPLDNARCRGRRHDSWSRSVDATTLRSRRAIGECLKTAVGALADANRLLRTAAAIAAWQ